jgi:hypothetical protein
MIVSPEGSLLPMVDSEDDTAGGVQRVHARPKGMTVQFVGIRHPTIVGASQTTANVTCTELPHKRPTFGPTK